MKFRIGQRLEIVRSNVAANRGRISKVSRSCSLDSETAKTICEDRGLARQAIYFLAGIAPFPESWLEQAPCYGRWIREQEAKNVG